MSEERSIMRECDLTVEIPMWRFTQLIRTEVKMNMIEDALMRDTYPDNDIMNIVGIREEWEASHKKESEDQA